MGNSNILSYPFPPRNASYKDEDIYYIKSTEFNYINFCFKKNTSIDSISIANQFFLVERMLLESFQFVLPIEQNGNTCSVKFATIIRESCNLFEIISRRIYGQFFKLLPKQKINILNFLSLDAHLNLTKDELRVPSLQSYHIDGRTISPYEELKSWNRNKEVDFSNIPKWWNAYNQIKHNVESVCSNATLDNAIYALAATFLLIRKVYGDGLISGFLRKKEEQKSDTILYQINTSNLFFGEIIKSRG